MGEGIHGSGSHLKWVRNTHVQRMPHDSYCMWFCATYFAVEGLQKNKKQKTKGRRLTVHAAKNTIYSNSDKPIVAAGFSRPQDTIH